MRCVMNRRIHAPPGALAGVRLAIAVALGLAIGCTGKIDGGSGNVEGDTANFPRLTHIQWENTVQDLFGLATPPGLATSFQPDPPLGKFDNNIARLQVTASHWVDYQRAAEEMAVRATDDAALLDSIAPGRDIDSFITNFGTRAFRRPITVAEIARYVASTTSELSTTQSSTHSLEARGSFSTRCCNRRSFSIGPNLPASRQTARNYPAMKSPLGSLTHLPTACQAKHCLLRLVLVNWTLPKA